MFSNRKEIAEIWLEINYPNLKTIDNRGMLYRDFPNYVEDYIKRKWYKEHNKSYIWYDKEYTDNTPNYNSYKTYGSFLF